MKILVTGGSGFLGSRLIPALVKDGHEVSALARSACSGEKARASGATPVRGDLENTEQLPLPAIDAVIHAAARFRFAGPREPCFRANVIGTKALLQGAKSKFAISPTSATKQRRSTTTAKLAKLYCLARGVLPQFLSGVNPNRGCNSTRSPTASNMLTSRSMVTLFTRPRMTSLSLG